MGPCYLLVAGSHVRRRTRAKSSQSPCSCDPPGGTDPVADRPGLASRRFVRHRAAIPRGADHAPDLRPTYGEPPRNPPRWRRQAVPGDRGRPIWPTHPDPRRIPRPRFRLRSREMSDLRLSPTHPGARSDRPDTNAWPRRCSSELSLGRDWALRKGRSRHWPSASVGDRVGRRAGGTSRPLATLPVGGVYPEPGAKDRGT
jgi:hypothetical protein